MNIWSKLLRSGDQDCKNTIHSAAFLLSQIGLKFRSAWESDRPCLAFRRLRERLSPIVARWDTSGRLMEGSSRIRSQTGGRVWPSKDCPLLWVAPQKEPPQAIVMTQLLVTIIYTQNLYEIIVYYTYKHGQSKDI